MGEIAGKFSSFLGLLMQMFQTSLCKGNKSWIEVERHLALFERYDAYGATSVVQSGLDLLIDEAIHYDRSM